MDRTIKKQEAIARVNQRYSNAMLDLHNTHFSNINARTDKDVWWFDIPLRKLAVEAEEIIHLLLYDYRSDEIYHLHVPTKFLRENQVRLVNLEEKGMVRLELSADRSNLFQDTRSGGGGVTFAQFLQ